MAAVVSPVACVNFWVRLDSFCWSQWRYPFSHRNFTVYLTQSRFQAHSTLRWTICWFFLIDWSPQNNPKPAFGIFDFVIRNFWLLFRCAWQNRDRLVLALHLRPLPSLALHRFDDSSRRNQYALIEVPHSINYLNRSQVFCVIFLHQTSCVVQLINRFPFVIFRWPALPSDQIFDSISPFSLSN